MSPQCGSWPTTPVAAGRAASAVGGTVQEAAFGGAKIWNSEIWPFLANWHLHCRTDSAYGVIYITLFQHRHVQNYITRG